MEILLIKRLRNWTCEQAAECFVVHPNTIRNWEHGFLEDEHTVFFGAAPWNKLSDAKRWLIHQVRTLGPEAGFGTRAIVDFLWQHGIDVSRRTVQRVLRENPPPAEPVKPVEPECPPGRPAPPHGVLCPERINHAWHLDLTTFDFQKCRWYVAAILDGFSRKVLALNVFPDAPTTDNLVELLKSTIATFGQPVALITDHGSQFRKRFKTAVRALGIDIEKGIGDRSKQFNGKVERFFKTLKYWRRRTNLPDERQWLQLRLNVFREWYNTKRPMHVLGGRTPGQAWNDEHLPYLKSYRANDIMQPVFKVWRENHDNDVNMPTVKIKIIGMRKRAA